MAQPHDECMNPSLGYMQARDLQEPRGVVRRQQTLVPGYVTTDDFGSDGKISASRLTSPMFPHTDSDYQR